MKVVFEHRHKNKGTKTKERKTQACITFAMKKPVTNIVIKV
jgi:hypothetical protein